jgi:SAM-dependent methyltransferase
MVFFSCGGGFRQVIALVSGGTNFGQSGHAIVPGVAKDTWERFAKSSAEHYICTEVDSSTPEGREAFFRSGEEYVDRMVAGLEGLLARRDAALDFGCGVGRLAMPLARHFARVTAVDISPTMLDKLAANCAERGVANVSGRLSDDDWEGSGPFDLVNSFLVFQHLADDAEVTAYLGRIAGCLAPTGVCVVQFDSRPRRAAYRLRNAIPDVVLPDRHRSGLRRIRRSPAALHSLLHRAGLSLIDEEGPGTELHVIRARTA